MSKSIIEKIYDKIDKLEKKKIDYLEVGNLRIVNKTEDDLDILRLALEGLSYKPLKEELNKYIKFVKERNLTLEFEQFKERRK